MTTTIPKKVEEEEDDDQEEEVRFSILSSSISFLLSLSLLVDDFDDFENVTRRSASKGPRRALASEKPREREREKEGNKTMAAKGSSRRSRSKSRCSFLCCVCALSVDVLTLPERVCVFFFSCGLASCCLFPVFNYLTGCLLFASCFFVSCCFPSTRARRNARSDYIKKKGPRSAPRARGLRAAIS